MAAGAVAAADAIETAETATGNSLQDVGIQILQGLVNSPGRGGSDPFVSEQNLLCGNFQAIAARCLLAGANGFASSASTIPPL